MALPPQNKIQMLIELCKNVKSIIESHFNEVNDKDDDLSSTIEHTSLLHINSAN